MTTLSSGLAASLAGQHVVDFYAIEILLPGYALRLVDGAGFVTFGGQTFRGRDATYGTLAAIPAYEDGVDNQSPRLSISLLPPTNTAAATLADPAAQGSQVSLWYGVLDPVSGLPVDTPHLEFIGELDVPTLKIGQARTLDYEVSSIWEKLFPRDDGARLNDAFHKSIWPGELGFAFVSDVQRQLPWGSDAPRPVNVTDIPNAGGGDYGGGGGYGDGIFF